MNNISQVISQVTSREFTQVTSQEFAQVISQESAYETAYEKYRDFIKKSCNNCVYVFREYNNKLCDVCMDMYIKLHVDMINSHVILYDNQVCVCGLTKGLIRYDINNRFNHMCIDVQIENASNISICRLIEYTCLLNDRLLDNNYYKTVMYNYNKKRIFRYIEGEFTDILYRGYINDFISPKICIEKISENIYDYVEFITTYTMDNEYAREMCLIFNHRIVALFEQNTYVDLNKILYMLENNNISDDSIIISILTIITRDKIKIMELKQKKEQISHKILGDDFLKLMIEEFGDDKQNAKNAIMDMVSEQIDKIING